MWYPSHKQNEAIKKFIEITGNYQLEESVGEQLAAPVTTTEKGIEIMAI